MRLILVPTAFVTLAATSPLWAQCLPQRLTSPSAFAGHYGFELAMNDRHLIVGDWKDYTMCGDPFCPNGFAYAYRRDAEGQWQLQQTIAPAGLTPAFDFGASVALDGDRALIGALLSPECGTRGAAYIFEFDGEQWVEAGLLCPPDTRSIHGDRVALHGDMALVGKANSSVLVYVHQDGRWDLVHDLYNPDSMGLRSDFGWGLDLDDDWVVIGAPVERITAGFGGAAYVYRRLPGGELAFTQKLIAPDILEGPQFGACVAIDGTTLAIGGRTSPRTYHDQGAMYMYELVGGRWELQQELTHSDPAEFDGFGRWADLEGDLLLVGADNDWTPTSRGAADLFQRGADGQWRQVADLDPELPAAAYGFRVAMAGGQAAIGGRNTVDIFDLSCLSCRPDLDLDGALTVFDFLTFLNLFQDADATADFDGDGELTIFDFLAFQTAFDAGCA